MDALGGNGGMGIPDMGGMEMGGDPMMGDPNMTGGDPNMMNGDPNMMDDGGMGNPDDPENMDPKKSIQQQTGKLSQDLNNYYNENGPDADLSKYVMGMISAQATKSMTDSDKKEVIQKIKKGDVADNEESEDLGESVFREKISNIASLKEMINNILEPDDYSKDRDEREIRNKFINKRKNPFVANR